MKILYVPFSREQAGDLEHLVQLWQENHLKNFSSPIRIIYFNERLNLKSNCEPIEVFICVHGWDNPSFMYVGNNFDMSKAEVVNIETLAYRYNHDFLYYVSRVSSVHLYCCGNYEKNKYMANQFNAQLLLQNKPVIFYSGTITIADSNGKQWSLGEALPVLINNKAHKVYSPDIELGQCFDQRKNIKKLPDYEEILDSKRNRFFIEQRERRQTFIQERRRTMNESITI